MLNSEKEKMQKATRNIVGVTLALLFIFITSDASADVVGSVKTIAKIIQTVGNGIFIILMVVGLVRTVSGFISNSPNAARNLLFLIFGVIIWFGFNTVVEDITTSVGGDSTGGFQPK